MSRHVILGARIAMLARVFGDGPWLWAATGRLMAASGLEPPVRPWYANGRDVTAVIIGYEREKYGAGYFNRSWRKRDRYARHVLEGNHGP